MLACNSLVKVWSLILLREKLESDSVDAVAKASRRRSVVENVP